MDRLAGLGHQIPLVLRGQRPMWQVMADVGETIVATMALLRDQSDPARGTLDSREHSQERRVADVFAETLGDMAANCGGPSSSAGVARAVLRYLALRTDADGIETWLHTLRSALLGETPAPARPATGRICQTPQD